MRRLEVAVYVPEERRPRDWAARIRNEEANFEHVPEHLRGMVLDYLSPEIDRHVRLVMTGRTKELRNYLLEGVQLNLRELVKAEAVRRFKAIQESATLQSK